MSETNRPESVPEVAKPSEAPKPSAAKATEPVPKTFSNTDAIGAQKNVKDIQFFGNGDTFQLLCKASSQSEGWMKSTKAMEIANVGCALQVTTQQRNPDGSYSVAEAITFIPGVKIVGTGGDRQLQSIRLG